MPVRYAKTIRNTRTAKFAVEHQLTAEQEETRERRITTVQTAITKLMPFEQLIIRRVHFEGATAQDVADEAVTDLQSVVNHHRRALRKLRKSLHAFAAGEFRIEPPEIPCIICRSPHRNEIDILLRRSLPANTYCDIMREIRSRFNVKIVSAMTIVGHVKYHC